MDGIPEQVIDIDGSTVPGIVGIVGNGGIFILIFNPNLPIKS